MTVLVNVLAIFQGIKRNLKKWQMHDFSMNLYSAEMLIFIGWNQRRFAISQCGKQNIPDGAWRD